MSVGPLSSDLIELTFLGAIKEESLPLPEDRKISRIATLFFQSPVVWTFTGLAASSYVLTAPVSLAITITLVCGMVTFPEYIPKSFLYEGAIIDSIGKNSLTNMGLLAQPYYNKICDGIYLGALPLKNFNHDKIFIEDLKIKAVLSLVEDDELTTETFISLPVQKSDWEANGIQVLHFRIKDMTSVSLEDLDRAADFIKEHKDGIYIHCKAGRGRSVMCLMAYLIKHEGKSYEEALHFVKDKRPATKLKSWQQDTLKDFSSKIKNTTATIDS